MQKLFVTVLLLSIPLVLFLFISDRDFSDPFRNGDEMPLVFFHDDVPLRVGIADTKELRGQGLSGRRNLGDTEGLLFIFDQAEYHGIWMKDMFIPIDIIWIDESFRVVHIEPNVSPATFPKIFEPDTPARFVIETNARFTESFGIVVGDEVRLPREAIPFDLQ